MGKQHKNLPSFVAKDSNPKDYSSNQLYNLSAKDFSDIIRIFNKCPKIPHPTTISNNSVDK